MERPAVTDLSHHHVQQIAQAHQRLDAHEGRLTKLETHTAVAAERSQHIQQSLTKIEGGISWITRLIIGALIAAAVAFIISGGLNVGQ